MYVYLTSEPHAVCQEIQKIRNMVAEGKVSHGQGENSSNDEECITPPAAKRVSLQPPSLM